MSEDSRKSEIVNIDSVAEALATGKYNRREVLSILGVAVAGIAVVSCGGTSTSAASTTTTGTGSSTSGSNSTGSSACAVTPEGEEGPYFVNDSASGFNRSNLLSNLDGTGAQPGIPLILNLYIYDSKNGCTPMQNVQVDIWHCNATGVYSDENVESTVGETWLRGYQITDANGLVTFRTIFPGWYQGRTTHIHLRLRSAYDNSSSGGTNTTQLFFPQTTIDAVNTSVAPYNSHGTNPTTNAGDRVYSQQTLGETLLTLTGDAASGYSANFKINLPV